MIFRRLQTPLKAALAGRLGLRIRKAFVAGTLFAGADVAWHMVRNPAWDGWWDAFTWPQQFLYAPLLFFFVVGIWQLGSLIGEWLYILAKRRTTNLEQQEPQQARMTMGFWLRDFLRILGLYIATSLIGDIPMAYSYVASVRKWPLPWSWSGAVDASLLLMIPVWWFLDRIFVPTQLQRRT